MNLHEKLLQVQLNLKAPKNQYNNFGKYKYRNLEDILEAVKPLLNEAKLLLTCSDEPIVIGDRFYIKATATITDIEKPEDFLIFTAYAREAENKKGMDVSQVTGATSSYARKYCLNGCFNIDDTKDADSQSPQNNQPQKNLMTKAQIAQITALAKELIPDATNKDIGKVAALLGVSSKTTTADQFEIIWKQAYDNQFQAVIEGLK